MVDRGAGGLGPAQGPVAALAPRGDGQVVRLGGQLPNHRARRPRSLRAGNASYSTAGRTHSTAGRGPGEVVEEDAVADARRIAGPRHLEGHEPAVVADHRVRRLEAGVLVEPGQPLPRFP